MESWAWLAAPAGAMVVIVVLTDVFLTVLHIDRDGPLARRPHLGIWHAAIGLGRLVPRWRRSLLGLAGPLMIVTTFAVWIAAYILGFALIYWPFPDGYTFDSRPPTFDFVDALYFSGKTGSTLGYGDIAPAAPALKVLSVVQATIGFGLLSGAVTYLLNTYVARTRRNGNRGPGAHRGGGNTLPGPGELGARAGGDGHDEHPQ
ncbi:MAG: potassium channel family protein [Pseudomonadales bacterium]